MVAAPATLVFIYDEVGNRKRRRRPNFTTVIVVLI